MGHARGVPGRPRAVLAVLEYHLVCYRRMWRSSITLTFVTPVLLLVGFGVGVGQFVSGVDGLPYLAFVVPGLLAATALQTAVGESTWTVFDAFRWNRTHFAQAATALRPADLALGRLVWVALRVAVAALFFLVVAYLAGAPRAATAAAAVPVAVLLALAVGGPSVALAASARSDTSLSSLYRLGVLPLTLFAGVYFPVEQLPAAARALAYASPLWHAADLCRAAMLGVPAAWSAPGEVAYLAAWALVGGWLAVRAFARQLVE